MIIERTDKEILIRIPNTIDVEGAQRIIDYIRYQEATSKTEAKQSDVDKLANEVNRDWWEKNKGFRGMRRFVSRFNFSCNLIGNHPQSLTGHSRKRWHQLKKNKNYE